MYLEFGAIQEDVTFKDVPAGKCFLIQNDKSEDMYLKFKIPEEEKKDIYYNAVNLTDGSIKRFTDGTKVFVAEVDVTIKF